jgi:hypothetical protein
MNSKRGIVGATIMLFVTTIVVVALLAAYVFGSGIIQLLDTSSAGVYSEGDIDEDISYGLVQKVIDKQINFYRLYSINRLSGGLP